MNKDIGPWILQRARSSSREEMETGKGNMQFILIFKNKNIKIYK